ncbi:MAG: hypothetical protein EOQ39_11770 [Mesorhizobium sp.]|nr:hypothetical protein EOD15_23240 [Mesorhizobium sp. M7A.T.Ca.US.000.02.2.1]RUT89335.1 hypothetical protein EOD14_02850 [Mesorhizobium sp. M7A.T.Ca.US.000.02.1.1]RUT97756.1 hypothetical protein EOD12_26525 [Mesorhizobium sp. M7A.T.Ca.TU.009.02.1.1]RUU61954.1 hypothetical protein EOC99_19310 [Mesorhizobium sp. M7A.T.Ca.TU.009.01.1.1]RUU75397.1 hypothetical protein EOD03_25020 [Mesorhizobium sp. M7A.T.Ca.TU.009.01.1.2]RWB07901.1 MAG: hypothetical protein EOQ37_07595 [Mesorhizobium sp.]
MPDGLFLAAGITIWCLLQISRQRLVGPRSPPEARASPGSRREIMNNIIWLVGAVVIVIAILSFFGLR